MYIDQKEAKAAVQQVKELADFVMKFYPGEIGKGNPKQGESVVDVVKRLLSPSEPVNDANAKVPNWAVDTLAKKELRRLAQYIMDSHAQHIGEGSVVDTAISMIEKAYLPTS